MTDLSALFLEDSVSGDEHYLVEHHHPSAPSSYPGFLSADPSVRKLSPHLTCCIHIKNADTGPFYGISGVARCHYLKV